MPISFELARTVPADVAADAVGVVAGSDRSTTTSPPRASRPSAATCGRSRARRGTRYVVGLGPAGEVTPDVIRAAAGAVARAAKRQPSVAVDLLGHLADPAQAVAGAQALAEGLVLGGYQFSTFKSDPKPSRLARVVVVGERWQACRGGPRPRAHAGRGGLLGARPRERAGRHAHADGARRAGRRRGPKAGFEVAVWDEKEIRKQKLGGLLGVNRGSEQPPRFIRARVRARQGRAAPSRSSARASRSTPAACRSSRPTAW